MTTTVLSNSEALQQQLAAPPVPDLSKKITPLSGQYCETGGFSDIYQCNLHGHDGVKVVAVKAFRFKFLVAKQGESKEKIGKMIRREMGIWKRISHPNIVPFLGITYGFGREGNASLVSLWMPNGTLHTLLHGYNDHLSDAHRLQLSLDISNGLSYLHSSSSLKPIVHGDLTCNNVLLDDNYTARLVDFGFASAVGNLPEALEYLRKITTGPGAIRWAAPEHFSENEIECTTKCDIYSLGNLIFFVLSGQYPWSGVTQDMAVMLQLSRGQKPARPKYRPIQDAHWALVQQCWAPVHGRPPAAGVASSLKGFLRSQPTPRPLREFLGNIPSGSSNPLSRNEGRASGNSEYEARRESAGHPSFNGAPPSSSAVPLTLVGISSRPTGSVFEARS